MKKIKKLTLKTKPLLDLTPNQQSKIKGGGTLDSVNCSILNLCDTDGCPDTNNDCITDAACGPSVLDTIMNCCNPYTNTEMPCTIY